MIVVGDSRKVTSSQWRTLWKDSIFIFFIAFITVVSVLYIYAKSLLILLFVTALLFILLDPIVIRLSRSVSHGMAVFIALIGFFGMLVMLMSMIFRTILPDLAGFIREFPAFVIHFDSSIVVNMLPPEFAEYGNQVLRDAVAFAVDIVKESVIPLIRTFSGVAEMIAVPFLTFYLLKDGRKIASSIADFLPPTQVKRFAAFFGDVNIVLGGYIRGQMLISIFSGFTVFLGMYILGLPYAHILALVSALSEFVPVIGSVVATVPGTLVALSYSPLLAFKVLLFYIILLKTNHNIIYPKVVGKAIKVHPIFIMVTILLFGHLFGITGMLFAVPAVAVGRVWLIHLFDKSNILHE
jgi:predicted PurR-regulated permease PerM